MLIDARRKRVRVKNYIYKLNEKELRLLLLLSDNEFHTTQEILEYMHISLSNFQTIKRNLKEKYNIEIYNLLKKGYEIKENIFIR